MRINDLLCDTVLPKDSFFGTHRSATSVKRRATQVIYDDYYLFCFGYILVFGVDDNICSANSNILLTIPKQCFHCVSLLIAFL